MVNLRNLTVALGLESVSCFSGLACGPQDEHGEKKAWRHQDHATQKENGLLGSALGAAKGRNCTLTLPKVTSAHRCMTFTKTRKWKVTCTICDPFVCHVLLDFIPTFVRDLCAVAQPPRRTQYKLYRDIRVFADSLKKTLVTQPSLDAIKICSPCSSLACVTVTSLDTFACKKTKLGSSAATRTLQA